VGEGEGWGSGAKGWCTRCDFGDEGQEVEEGRRGAGVGGGGFECVTGKGSVARDEGRVFEEFGEGGGGFGPVPVNVCEGGGE
jgi:hypothetical protein